MDALQALIDALAAHRDSTATEPPDLFGGHDDDSLAAMEVSVAEAAATIREGRLTDDAISQLEQLAQAAVAIRNERTARVESADALNARAAELLTQITPPADTPADAPASAEGAPPAATATNPAAGDSAPVEGEVVTPERELVHASATTRPRARVDLAAIRRNAPPVTVNTPATPDSVVTAAADLPGYASGQQITDMKDLARAITARFSAMPIGSPGVEVHGGIATVRRNFPLELTAGGNSKDDSEVLEYAADETRLPGGSLLNAASLLAAAGDPRAISPTWCAPYEIDTTLCSTLETLSGFIDVPTVGVRPPGVIYPGNMPWWKLYDLATLQEFCDPCAGPKPVISIPCPTWAQDDLCIEPFIIESCILRERAYPQWTDQFTERATMAFRRWQHVQTLTKLRAKIDAPHKIVGMQSISATQSIFDSVAYLVAWYKDLYRMDPNFTFEFVAPMWLREVARADMAKKQRSTSDRVTDGDIDAEFADRGARIQYIYDFQSLATASGASPLPPFSGGGSTPVPSMVWPTQVTLIMFPAGTFVAGRAELFRISGIYDAANLKQNKYTKVMFEDGTIVMQRCYEAFEITIPLCINGAVGPRIDACAGPQFSATRDASDATGNTVFVTAGVAGNSIDWGDGTAVAVLPAGGASHAYVAAGTYTISVYPTGQPSKATTRRVTIPQP